MNELTPEQHALIQAYNSIVLKINIKPELAQDQIPTQEEMDAMIAQDLLDAAAPYASEVARHASWTPKSSSYVKHIIPSLQDIRDIASLTQMIDFGIESERVGFYRNRLDSMIAEDAGMPAFYMLVQDVPNYALYFNQMLSPEKSEEVEAFVSALEVKHVEFKAKAAQEKINQEALAYLASTDFYVIREMDGGAVCPADIKAARAAARLRVIR